MFVGTIVNLQTQTCCYSEYNVILAHRKEDPRLNVRFQNSELRAGEMALQFRMLLLLQRTRVQSLASTW